MKKAILSIFVLLAVVTGAAGVSSLGTVVSLQTEIIDPTVVNNPFPKSPVQPPSLWQDGHELSFAASHPACALDLVQNGIVVYSVDVDESTTSVVLPSWLTGEYELQLYPEDCDYYFYGYIIL